MGLKRQSPDIKTESVDLKMAQKSGRKAARKNLFPMIYAPNIMGIVLRYVGMYGGYPRTLILGPSQTLFGCLTFEP